MTLGAKSWSPSKGLLFWSFGLLFGAASVLIGCSSGERSHRTYTGAAQGTTYRITIVGSNQNERELSAMIEGIFLAMDASMSTYVPSSIISRLNTGDTNTRVDTYFSEVYRYAWTLSEESDGAFDCTVGALVNAYGFGPQGRVLKVDSIQLAKILSRTGYEKVHLFTDSTGTGIRFEVDSMQLDFNALAQGYTVDVLADSIAARGYNDFLIEVGGELAARGLNSRNEPWKIGIDRPSETIDTEDRFVALVQLQNQALATSGNYRKFWVDSVTGVKYVHSINPKTGRAVSSNLLSCTITAPRAMQADAWATACMIIGFERALELIQAEVALEAMFVYVDESGEVLTHQTESFPILE